VLPYRFRFNLDAVEFSVVAERNPATLPANLKPVIVFHSLIKAQRTTMLPLGYERRLGLMNRLGEALPKTSIEVEC
jgi:hypothetical protein